MRYLVVTENAMQSVQREYFLAVPDDYDENILLGDRLRGNAAGYDSLAEAISIAADDAGVEWDEIGSGSFDSHFDIEDDMHEKEYNDCVRVDKLVTLPDLAQK